MHKIIFQQKGLSLEKLNLLCKVTRSGGIRAAVGDDPSTQSLASRQLKELSSYVGAPLLRRVGRTIELTETGQQLATLSTEFFSNLEHFLQATRNLPEVFRLGVGDAIFQWYILPKISDFKTTVDADLHPASLPTDEIVRKVLNHELNAGIIRYPIPLSPELIAEPIGDIRYQLFVPKQLLPKKNTKKLPPLNELPICTLTGNGHYAQAVNTLLSGVNTASKLSCASTTQIYSAVHSGQFAAILPIRAKTTFPSSILAFNMTELAAFTRKIAIIYLKNNAEAPILSKALTFLKTLLVPEN